jgi:fatty acid desaturase
MESNRSARRALSRVEWRDLLATDRVERAGGLLLPWPFLAGEILFLRAGLPVPAVVAAFLFFTAGWRQAHDAMHRTLGVGRRGHDLLLLLLSVVMVIPQHAVRYCHLRHHADPLAADDVESWGARGGALRALVLGPTFAPRLAARALVQGGSATRAWVIAEIAILVVITYLVAIGGSDTARQHVFLMLLGVGLTGDFAVWVGHRGCDPRTIVARTERSPLLDLATFGLLYHFEHHVFPAVPTCHLPELGRRVDRAYPRIANHSILPRARARPAEDPAPATPARRRSGPASVRPSSTRASSHVVAGSFR